MLNRKGLIRITRDSIEKDTERVLETLEDVLVLSVEYNPLARCYDYTTCSKYFDEVKEGELIPFYAIDEYKGNIKWYRIPEYYRNR
ncbi:hypothetical protein [Clostridium sp.]|uniref:hypothetical protein n=1 Tax=Clostridium sp. TaxID=1506 RepID=UPI0032171FBC